MPKVPFKRNSAPITRNEYSILLNVHQYLNGSGPFYEKQEEKLSPRKRLALITGVGLRVSQEAIRLSVSGEEPTQNKIGRPKRHVDPELICFIREFVLTKNKAGIPVHSKLILQELARKKNLELNERTLRNYLQHIGLHYGKGNKKNILHDSQQVIDYRNIYIKHRLNNLNSNGLPIIPEVFLDESYCHLDHHSQCTWIPTDGIVNERGRKPMLAIFGAFIVFTQDNKLKANLVRDSILIWPVKGNIRGQASRRVARDNELWRMVPDFVREARIAPDYHDYHGNFTSELFEKLFERLCTILTEDYGPCHIHMDGAKYHLRKENPQPNSASKVVDIKAWFEQERIPLPVAANGRAMTKTELLSHIKELNIPPIFASYHIAGQHGHTIMKTPPYHCELQPIEQIWGIAKNRIAVQPNLEETELSLRNRLLEQFASISSYQLLASWKKTVKNNRNYQAVCKEGLESGVDELGSEESEDNSDME